MSRVLVISGEDCRKLLSIENCIPQMQKTFEQVSQGVVRQLQRAMLPTNAKNMFALMPALNEGEGIVGSKVIVFPGPGLRGKDTDDGIVPLFDSTTGQLLAIVEGKSITVIRTAAATAAATNALARQDSSVLCILGCGKQGIAHARAICAVRPIQKLCLGDGYDNSCAAAVEQLRDLGVQIQVCPTGQQACKDADIICTIAGASQPILMGDWVKPGAHINAVGACSPFGREVDTKTLLRSDVFMDSTECALRDGGDLVIPIQAGEYSKEDIKGEIGQVFLGSLPGRTSLEQITLFETVGIAAEDLAAAQYIYQQAVQKELGTWVNI